MAGYKQRCCEKNVIENAGKRFDATRKKLQKKEEGERNLKNLCFARFFFCFFGNTLDNSASIL